MKGFTQLLMIISGLLVAPFLVTFVAEFFGGEGAGYAWLPFFIVLLIGGVTYAVGVLRGVAIGILVGDLLFAALLLWYPRVLQWLPENVKNLQPPF